MIKPNLITGQSREKWEEDIRRNNLEWAKSIDKWGDINYLVFSDLPELVEEKFNTQIVDKTLRHIKRLKDGQTKTFGVIVASKEYVFLNKTNYRLRRDDVSMLLEEISLLWEHFPEYRDKKLIGVITCLYFDEANLANAEQNGFLVMGVGFKLLEIKNRPNFEPKVWVYNA